MAAIDKFYINSWHDFNMLRVWALRYYPKLFTYMFEPFMSADGIDKQLQYCANKNFEINKKEYFRTFGDPSLNNGIEFAIENIIKQYKDGVGYNCSYEQAKEEAEDVLAKYNKTFDEILEDTYIPVAAFPFSVDKKLKWICPLPFVREYLQKQCGVKKNREWLYRLFWRGKAEFSA